MTRQRIATYESQLQALGARWDELIARVPAQTWGKRYGPDWTYADVPWHLAYFDRVMVGDVIEQGDRLPPEQRFDLSTVRQLNDWNAAEFAKRPAGTTAADSVAEMRRQRERVRRLLAGLTDDDLARPAYNHFFGVGFQTVEGAIVGARLHSWSELFEFALRLTGRPPAVDAAIVHAGLDNYLRLMPVFANPEVAARLGRFAVEWEIAGAGGGVWTIAVEDGVATSREGPAPQPDVRLRMDADTYMRLFKKLANPMLLMLTGKMKVRPFSRMGTFGRLFSDPPLDRAPDPRQAGEAFVVG